MFNWSDHSDEKTGSTTIQVSINTYKNINSAKNPGESFDETLESLLKKLSRYEKSDCEPKIERRQARADPTKPLDSIQSAVRERTSKSTYSEEKVEVMRKVIAYLSEEKSVGKKEFVSELYEDNHLNYTNKRSWWEDFVRPCLDEFSHAKKPQRGGKWKYTGSKE